MSGTEVALYFVAGSFALAFAIRLIKIYAEMVYNLAPMVFFMVAFLFVVYYHSVDNSSAEGSSHDANHIESIKD
jgi:hypothetical protein